MTGSGDRPDRAPESAAFETTRVVRARGRPPFFILGVLVVIAGLVIVGVGGRSGPGSALPHVTAGTASVTETATPGAPGPSATILAMTPDGTLAAVPVVTSGPGPVQLQASRLRASVFVHGDVFVPRVTWVFIGLQDDTGQVVGWASVSVPGAVGPGIDGGPTLRFDVEVAVPDRLAGPLSLHANAYDAGGTVVGSAVLAIPDDGG